MLYKVNVSIKTKYHKMCRNGSNVAHDADDAVCVKRTNCVQWIKTTHEDTTDAKEARWAKAMPFMQKPTRYAKICN